MNSKLSSKSSEFFSYGFNPSLYLHYFKYLGIPVLVQIVDAGDAAAITVGVVHMSNVTCSISWVASHHRL